jgi:hypothetical protein
MPNQRRLSAAVNKTLKRSGGVHSRKPTSVVVNEPLLASFKVTPQRSPTRACVPLQQVKMVG